MLILCRIVQFCLEWVPGEHKLVMLNNTMVEAPHWLFIFILQYCISSLNFIALRTTMSPEYHNIQGISVINYLAKKCIQSFDWSPNIFLINIIMTVYEKKVWFIKRGRKYCFQNNGVHTCSYVLMYFSYCFLRVER